MGRVASRLVVPSPSVSAWKTRDPPVCCRCPFQEALQQQHFKAALVKRRGFEASHPGTAASVSPGLSHTYISLSIMQ